jgi:hypothetical protein
MSNETKKESSGMIRKAIFVPMVSLFALVI